jgi:hypothetical protein
LAKLDMQDLNISLEQFLLDRKLTQPLTDTEILDTPEKLSRAAAAWQDSKEGITLVLNAKIAALREYVSDKAIPQEVTVYRQAIVEIAGILSDFERYAAENARRLKQENHD